MWPDARLLQHRLVQGHDVVLDATAVGGALDVDVEQHALLDAVLAGEEALDGVHERPRARHR